MAESQDRKALEAKDLHDLMNSTCLLKNRLSLFTYKLRLVIEDSKKEDSSRTPNILKDFSQEQAMIIQMIKQYDTLDVPLNEEARVFEEEYKERQWRPPSPNFYQQIG